MSYLNNLRIFVRVYELGNMSAAARDQRCSPAVASARIAELEKYLAVRLFNRSTRSLQPTENGRIFYAGATRILDEIRSAEAAVMESSQTPRGTIFLSAPLGLGRRLIAPLIPAFHALYPQVELRLRLSDRSIDVVAEGIDLAIHLGPLDDSSLRMRQIAECPRVLCASPAYIARCGMPQSGDDLVAGGHVCLNLRYPGAREFQWSLQTETGLRRFDISGPFESDDGDVLLDWARAGHGITLKPLFEVAQDLRDGRLAVVAPRHPPLPSPLCALSVPSKWRDPKLRLLGDYIAAHLRESLRPPD